MLEREKILFQGKTAIDQYQVIDMIYEGRKARVLFSGDKTAAFSGMPLDGEHTLLFDYIQRFFELVSHVRPKRLLMIGGGVYTLPVALIHALPDITIDVVEIDPGLDAIAEGFFGFTPDARLHIIHADGKDFLDQSKQTYDLVIIDAFTDLHIPKSLAGLDTAQLIKQRLSKNGIVAINIISSFRGRSAQTIEQFYELYSSIFEHTAIYPADSGVSLWMSQNFILISQKGIKQETYGLRFGALELLQKP
jgi:spermidine synthase